MSKFLSTVKSILENPWFIGALGFAAMVFGGWPG